MCDIFCDLPFFHLENHCDHWKHHCCTAGIKEVMYTQKSAGWTSSNQTATWTVCGFTHRQKQLRETVCPASSNDGKCWYLLGRSARWIIFLFINLIICTSLIIFSLAQARKNLQLNKKKQGFFPPKCFLFRPIYSAFEGDCFSTVVLLGPLKGMSLSRCLNLENILIFELGRSEHCIFLKCHQLAQFRNCFKYVRKPDILSKLWEAQEKSGIRIQQLNSRQ